MTDHSHWSGFDENLEMLEFDRLQYMCRVGEPIADGDWKRLVRLARAAGYADADSFLSSCEDDPSEDTPEQAAQRELFDSYQDDEYWNAIDKSERILGSAGGELANRQLARKVCDLMRDAYEVGRKFRIENDQFVTTPKL